MKLRPPSLSSKAASARRLRASTSTLSYAFGFEFEFEFEFGPKQHRIASLSIYGLIS